LYFLVEEEEATRDNCKLQKHEVILACAIEKPVVHKNKQKKKLAPVAQSCNPSYSRSRDQEDCGSKPAQATSS
jgi:hypothetical protein